MEGSFRSYRVTESEKDGKGKKGRDCKGMINKVIK